MGGYLSFNLLGFMTREGVAKVSISPELEIVAIFASTKFSSIFLPSPVKQQSKESFSCLKDLSPPTVRLLFLPMP